MRDLIVDWDVHARQALAEFRAATITVRHDPQIVELVSRLSDASAEFRAVEAGARRRPLRDRLRRFNHPRAGLLTSSTSSFRRPMTGMQLMMQLPVPGDDSAQRLAVRHRARSDGGDATDLCDACWANDPGRTPPPATDHPFFFFFPPPPPPPPPEPDHIGSSARRDDYDDGCIVIAIGAVLSCFSMASIHLECS